MRRKAARAAAKPASGYNETLEQIVARRAAIFGAGGGPAEFFDDCARLARAAGRFESANLMAIHAEACRDGAECFSGMGQGLPFDGGPAYNRECVYP